MNLSSRRGDEPEINLISLIDVLFVLVIFLMVTTTFAQQTGLRLELPKASPAPETATRILACRLQWIAMVTISLEIRPW
jgi:biopolymer transport protein ExbD